MKKIIHKIMLLTILISVISCSPKQELGNNYFLDNGKIIYRYKSSTVSWPVNPLENKYMDVENADVESFTALEPYGYAKDKNNFYYKGNKIENIDFATFEVSGNSSTGIAKDKNYVYQYSNPNIKIENIDAKTYQKVIFPKSTKVWYKDKNHFYLNNEPIKVDVNTFTALNENFYADSDHIYYFKRDKSFDSFKEPDILNQKLIDTVQKLQTNNYIYTITENLNLKRIPIKKDSKIQFFNSYFAFIIVDNQVYCNGDLMDEVDFDTFEFFTYPNSKSPTEFSKDKNHVYYYDEILVGADPKTAKLNDKNQLVDGDYKWVPDLYSTNNNIFKEKIDE